MFAWFMLWLTLGVFYGTVLGHDLNNPGGVWVLTTFLGYPIVVMMVVRFAQWRDSGFRITALDEDGDGDVSVTEMVKYVNFAPLFFTACVVFIWVISVFGSRIGGVILALVFVLCILGFIFLRDWAKNDYYLSPVYQKAGTWLVKLGMGISLFVGLAVNTAPLIICLSMFFFLFIMQELITIFARRFIMEPDVPIYISPYIFPIYSYSSRSNDVIEETSTGVRVYTVMMACIMWGLCFAIFVEPQSLGITIACISIVGTVVVTAVLIEQVPLALGTCSRFLDSATIVEAAETAKTAFQKRRKPIEFECAEWDEQDRNDPSYIPLSGPKAEERKSAAELALELASQFNSLRKTKTRRNTEKIHSEYMYNPRDAMVEALIAGKGLFGGFGCGGVWYRCMNIASKRTQRCFKSDILRQYDQDGQRIDTERLKRRFDSQAVYLDMSELDAKIIHEFHEELRCVIHLWLLLIVAADGRLRREKVLFQQFLRENRFKLLSNGIAPPKNIFSSASFASINIPLVAVWLTTLTPEERERFHLLKSKFSEEQAKRDAMVDASNAQIKADAEAVLMERKAREDEMCRKRHEEITVRREARYNRWQASLDSQDQRKLLKYKAQWMKNAMMCTVDPMDEPLYKNFMTNVTIQGGDEALVAVREALQEIESAERNCKPGQFGRPYQFYDPDFAVGTTSLGKDCGVEMDEVTWNVSLSLNADACLFENGTDPDDIFKGRLSDDWLLSAISMVAAVSSYGGSRSSNRRRNSHIDTFLGSM